MHKVNEGEELFTLYIGYPWYQQISEYLDEHDTVGTMLCEACFDKIFTALGMTPAEIEGLKTEQRNERQ